MQPDTLRCIFMLISLVVLVCIVLFSCLYVYMYIRLLCIHFYMPFFDCVAYHIHGSILDVVCSVIEDREIFHRPPNGPLRSVRTS